MGRAQNQQNDITIGVKEGGIIVLVLLIAIVTATQLSSSSSDPIPERELCLEEVAQFCQLEGRGTDWGTDLSECVQFKKHVDPEGDTTC